MNVLLNTTINLKCDFKAIFKTADNCKFNLQSADYSLKLL
jgi:hypothetical protein